MSVDYYLVSREKKVWMPIFSMKIGGCWLADRRYVFDFILAAGNDIKLVHEGAEDTIPAPDDKTWSYINSFVPYPAEPK